MKPVKLQFEYRCDQNWNSMRRTEVGRFCNQCNRNIIDFSIMSDTEIINYLKTHKEICGKLHESQLDRALIQSDLKRRKGWVRWASLIFSAIASSSLIAQNTTTPINTNYENSNDNLNSAKNENGQVVSEKNASEIIVLKGKVINGATGKKVAGAKIFIDSAHTVKSDKHGYFEVQLKKSDLVNKTFLMASKKKNYGYYNLSPSELPETIIIKLHDGSLVGWVVNPLIYLQGD